MENLLIASISLEKEGIKASARTRMKEEVMKFQVRKDEK